MDRKFEGTATTGGYKGGRAYAPRPEWKPGYRNFYGPGKFKYAIYPDNGWDIKRWGQKPLLGYVYADDEFYATREAYTKGLAPVNYTFGLSAIKQKQEGN